MYMIFIYWIIFGLIVGSIANYLSPNSSGGIVGSIILGIVGAVVGGYLGQIIFNTGVTGFNVISIVLSVFGSLLVLYLVRLMNKTK